MVIPKLVIFDLDGTLIEFPKDFLHLETERLIKDYGHREIPREVLEKSFHEFDYFRVIDEEFREDFVKFFNKNFKWNEFPSPVLFPGTIELLSELSQLGVVSAIATARDQKEESLRQELINTKIIDHVSIVATRIFEDQHWTDKRPQINYILEKAKIKKEEAMFISDTPGDLQSARDVGIKTVIAVLSGGVARDILSLTNPCHVLEGVEEVLSLFRKL